MAERAIVQYSFACDRYVVWVYDSDTQQYQWESSHIDREVAEREAERYN